MARILAYTSPGRSHLFPLTPILDELHRRGHQIVLRTLASQVDLMQARGFDAAPISAPIEAIEHDDWRARNPLQSVRRTQRSSVPAPSTTRPTSTRPSPTRDPDALLVDINSWGGLMAAEAWGGPWAVFCPYPLALPSDDAPPFGPRVRPRSRAARPSARPAGSLARARGGRKAGAPRAERHPRARGPCARSPPWRSGSVIYRCCCT